MKIKGNYTINSSRENVWKMLTDPEVLAAITPGVKSLESIDKDQYQARSEVKIGPVNGTFEGKLSLEDMVENEKMTVSLDQKSNMGNAVAKIGLALHTMEDGNTEIVYGGDAKLSGRLASMGQRILGGVITSLSRDFFLELENEIIKRSTPDATLKKKPSLIQRIIQFIKDIFRKN